ncbi:putative arabinose 5-phosphate isomerase [Colletotrichum gloeosporioides]|uniref:Putative arabinose 5-phosphate isomerase n=1 Tax=Colletotrichum gloeosporioides TaxID=474922 RepID=A0A8H4CSF7_COLGL|nr:putative arabinose 5-phosphate isomerase [Colletotrichum gloeosporioides]KAF3808977.1 putative arabinose 5-phosphate isomerase [Colletotrichum gloeosporioides]
MGDSRYTEHRPVQTSAVYVLGAPHCESMPPPSPPSPPVSPPEDEFLEELEELSLGSPDEMLETDENSVTVQDRLHAATHVLKTEAAALRSVAALYETDPVARDGFNRTVAAITRHKGEKGKLVITGVGKSGHIANKLVATFNSLSIASVFLNPIDALHGDLGIVQKHDILMFITFSGKTSELFNLLPHLDKPSSLIILTGHTRPDTCELIKLRPDTILLPAPIHESETASFGVSAPTTSTTVALAVGDALAIAAGQELHPSMSQVFSKNHPGGAIGAAFRKPQTILDLAVPWTDIPDLVGLCTDSVGADLFRAAYDSTSGWVRIGNDVASPGRIRKLATEDFARCLNEIPGLMVPRAEMLSISSETTIRRAVNFVRNMQGAADDGEYVCRADSILAVLDQGDMVGVLEVGKLLEWKD